MGEFLTYVQLTIPAITGVVSAVITVVLAVKKMKEAIDEARASKEFQDVAEYTKKLIDKNSELTSENKQLHEEIRLLIDQIKGIKGYSDFKLGGKSNDGGDAEG